MHRSGTSALAGMIARLGAALPRHIMPGDSNNERGYFESCLFMAFNDELLWAAGSCMHDWRSLNQRQLAAFEERARGLLDDEFGDAPFIVIKDPRICRFAPFWLTIFERAEVSPRVVVPFRSPFEVARSLHLRDGFPIEKGLLLWLRHVLDAERATRSLPRAFVSFDDLLANWRTCANRIVRDAGVAWPRFNDETAADVDKFLSTDLKHHNLHEGETIAAPEQVARAYDALTRLSRNLRSRSACAALDKIAASFDGSCALFDSAFISEARLAQIQAREAEWKEQAASRDREIAARDGMIASLEQALAGRDATVAPLEEALSERKAAVQALETEVGSLGRSLAEREAAISSLEQAQAGRDAMIASLDAMIASLKDLQRESDIAAASRQTAIASLEQALAGRDATVASLEEALSERKAAVQALETEVGSLGQSLAEREAAISSLEQAQAGRDAMIASLKDLQRESDIAAASRQAAIASLEQALAARQAANASLEGALAARQGAIASLEQALAGREAAIMPLEEALRERKAAVQALETEVGSLSETLAKRDGTIASLEQASASRDATIASGEATIASLEEALSKREAAVQALGMEVGSLGETLAKRDETIARLGQALGEREVDISALERALAGRAELIAAVQQRLVRLSARRAAKEEPEKHGFFRFGKSKPRVGLPDGVAPEAYEAVRESLFFDADFYVAAYPVVKASGTDPALHYLLCGGFEGLNPSPFFSTKAYFAEHPDVAGLRMNPLAHYELHGRAEGRKFVFAFADEQRPLLAAPETVEPPDAAAELR